MGPRLILFHKHMKSQSLVAFLLFAASTARGSWYNSTGRSRSAWLEELYQGLKEFDPEYKNPCFTTESGEWRCLPYFNVIGAPVVPPIEQTVELVAQEVWLDFKPNLPYWCLLANFLMRLAPIVSQVPPSQELRIYTRNLLLCLKYVRR